MAWQQRATLFLSHSPERGIVLLSLSCRAPHCCPLASQQTRRRVCVGGGVLGWGTSLTGTWFWPYVVLRCKKLMYLDASEKGQPRPAWRWGGSVWTARV